MQFSQLADHLKGQLIGDNVAVGGISIDSRTIEPGEIYVALIGERCDGHDYINEAVQKGAAGVICAYKVETNVPQLIVEDTKKALADCARYYRQTVSIPFAAVTGSCGKTTTRALLESILKQSHDVLASIKSFNNDIGVPLTLLRLKPKHQFAVIEMGANHPGEIAQLTHLVQPNVAIITLAGAAHLDGFGDIAGVACAKGEIFQGLSEEGTAIINADDQYADFWKNLVGNRKILTFGIKANADVTAKNIKTMRDGSEAFDLFVNDEQVSIELPLVGEHNVMNALAAAAAAKALGISLEDIQKGLAQVSAEKSRLVVHEGFAGARIIDDSYNANPTSVRAAIEILAKQSGRSILVLGDMLEMGDESSQLHRELGELAKAARIDQLYCYGNETKNTAAGFGYDAKHFSDHDSLISSLKNHLDNDVTVLVKGSNSMQMSKVAKALMI